MRFFAGPLRGQARGRLQNSKASHAGFTLLEVILAIAILGVSLAFLGEGLRLGLRNSKVARDQVYAQFLCESKMTELATQLLPLQPIQAAPIEEDLEWTYSIMVEPVDDQGLMVVYVTVGPAHLEPGSRSEFTLTRWMRDPETVLEQRLLAEENLALRSESTASSDTTSGSSSSSGSSFPGVSSGSPGGLP